MKNPQTRFSNYPSFLGEAFAPPVTTYPPIFYRVTKWAGYWYADFRSKAEAASFAVSDARASGCRFDHAVAIMRTK